MLGQDFESYKDQGHYVVENEMTILVVCFVLTGFMFCKWYRCYRLLLPREVPAEIPRTYLPLLPYFSPHKPANDTRPSTTPNDEGNTAVIVIPLTPPLPTFDAPTLDRQYTSDTHHWLSYVPPHTLFSRHKPANNTRPSTTSNGKTMQ